MPTWRSTPNAGCSISTVMPRACACGAANASTTSRIGPHGTSACVERREPVGRRAGREACRRAAAGARRDARPGRRSSRTADRRRAQRHPAPRRTAATAARCRPPRRARHRRSRTSRTGRCSGGRCRGGRAPGRSTNAFCAWFTRTARVDSSSETSIRWPEPAVPSRSRASRLARIADRREQPGDDVADRDADLHRRDRRRVGIAGDRHQPADRLDHEVVAGLVRHPARPRPQPLIARWTSRGFSASRAASSKPSRAKPPTRKFSTSTSASRRSRRRTSRPASLPQVEPDRALVAVDRQVVGRGPRPGGLVADPRRAPAARRVALGRLDLDDVRARGREEHRAQRPGEDRRAVDDAETGERTGRRRARASAAMVGAREVRRCGGTGEPGHSIGP